MPHLIGTFPKIHPFWKGSASLTSTRLLQESCVPAVKSGTDCTKQCTRWHQVLQVSRDCTNCNNQVAPGVAGIMCSSSQGKVSSCSDEAQVRQVLLCLRHNLFSGDGGLQAVKMYKYKFKYKYKYKYRQVLHSLRHNLISGNDSTQCCSHLLSLR